MTRIKQRGFTLLELVVSITILTLIALMISRIFSDSSRAVRQGRTQAMLDESARLILDAMATDISQALIRTNIPFRVSTVSVGDSLYCVSTAIRRGQDDNPRDTAPVQFRSIQTQELEWSLNRRATFKYADGAASHTDTGRRELIKQSNTYRAPSIAVDGTRDFTEKLKDLSGITEQAMLSFLDFRINGDFDSNRSATALPQVADRPRYVDVILGLTSAADLRQAMRLYSAQGADAASDFLEPREQIYTRRIFLPNAGLSRINLK